MTRVERAPKSPERHPTHSWKHLRSQEAGKIYVGGVCWDPTNMPGDLDIDTNEVNRLLDNLGLDVLVEIANKQAPRSEPQISGINGSGAATISASAVAQETILPTEQGNQKLLVNIDFAGLRTQAFYLSEGKNNRDQVYAELVGRDLRQKIRQHFQKELAPAITRDSLRFSSLMVSLLASFYVSVFVAMNAEPGSLEMNSTLFGALFFIIAAKVATSTFIVMDRLKNDQKFNDDIAMSMGDRMLGSPEEVEDAFNEERNKRVWEEVLRVPLIESASKQLAAMNEDAYSYINRPQLFRPATR